MAPGVVTKKPDPPMAGAASADNSPVTSPRPTTLFPSGVVSKKPDIPMACAALVRNSPVLPPRATASSVPFQRPPAFANAPLWQLRCSIQSSPRTPPPRPQPLPPDLRTLTLLLDEGIVDFALWTPPCRVNGGTLLGDDDRRPVFTQALAHGEGGVGPALAWAEVHSLSYI